MQRFIPVKQYRYLDVDKIQVKGEDGTLQEKEEPRPFMTCNGAEFFKMARVSDGEEFVMAALPTDSGEKCYDVMKLHNWQIMARNSHAIQFMCKKEREAQQEAQKERVSQARERIATLKPVNLQPAALVAVLKTESYRESEIQEALKAEGIAA